MSEERPYTRTELDQIGCARPGCDHTAHDGLFLHCADHEDASSWIEYRAVSGTLRVTCAQCDALLLAIAVAP
jgi:hypothetical protein